MVNELNLCKICLRPNDVEKCNARRYSKYLRLHDGLGIV